MLQTNPVVFWSLVALFLLVLGYVTWRERRDKNSTAREDVTSEKPRSFDEPSLNTDLQYATQSLDCAEEELKKLNFGLVAIRLSNYFVTIQSLSPSEKASIEGRGEDLAKKFHPMAQEAIKLRDQHFPPNRETPP